MALERFVMEMGTGIDQHGQDSTKAATRAIEDAVRRICLAGLMKILRICDPNEMIVHALIRCPILPLLKKTLFLDVLPFGRKQIEVIDGV